MLEQLYQQAKKRVKNPKKNRDEVQDAFAELVNLELQKIDQLYNEEVENQEQDAERYRGAAKRAIVEEYRDISTNKFEWLEPSILMDEFALQGADLSGVNLCNASFEDADLRDVNFTDANCYNCTFDSAELIGANFTEASLVKASFDNARIDETTLLISVDNRHSNLADWVGDEVAIASKFDPIYSLLDLVSVASQVGSVKELQALIGLCQVAQFPDINTQAEGLNNPAIFMIKSMIAQRGEPASKLKNTKIALAKAFLEDPRLDWGIEDERGRNLLHYVLSYGNPDLIAIAMEKVGSDASLVNKQDQDGETPLLYASRKSGRFLATAGDLLKDSAIDFTEVDRYGYTALMVLYRVPYVSQSAVKALLTLGEEGIDIGIGQRNLLGQTAKEIALSRKQPTVQIEAVENVADEVVDAIAVKEKAFKAQLIMPFIERQRLTIDAVKIMVAFQSETMQDNNPDVGGHLFYVESKETFAQAMDMLEMHANEGPRKAHRFEFHIRSNFQQQGPHTLEHFGSMVMDVDAQKKVDAVCYETLGLSAYIIPNSLLNFTDSVIGAFPDARIFVNSEKIQRDSKSCKLINFAVVADAPFNRVAVSDNEEALPLYEHLEARIIPISEYADYSQRMSRFVPGAPNAFKFFEQEIAKGRNFHVVRPYGMPAKLYQHVQYLGAFDNPSLGITDETKQTVTDDQTLEEAVEASTQFSVKRGKNVNKARRNLARDVADDLIVLLAETSQEDIAFMLNMIEVKNGMDYYVQVDKLGNKQMRMSEFFDIVASSATQELRDCLEQVVMSTFGQGQAAIKEKMIGFKTNDISPHHLMQLVESALYQLEQRDVTEAVDKIVGKREANLVINTIIEAIEQRSLERKQ